MEATPFPTPVAETMRRNSGSRRPMPENLLKSPDHNPRDGVLQTDSDTFPPHPPIPRCVPSHPLL